MFRQSMSSVAYAGKNFGGVLGYGRPLGSGGGGGAPGRRRIFEILQKIFLKKIAKSINLEYFSKKFNKPCVNFSRVWTKNKLLGNFEKFSKISMIFYGKKKILKVVGI